MAQPQLDLGSTAQLGKSVPGLDQGDREVRPRGPMCDRGGEVSLVHAQQSGDVLLDRGRAGGAERAAEPFVLLGQRHARVQRELRVVRYAVEAAVHRQEFLDRRLRIRGRHGLPRLGQVAVEQDDVHALSLGA